MKRRIALKKATNALLLLLAGPEKRAQRRMRKELIAVRKSGELDEIIKRGFKDLAESIKIKTPL